MQLLIVDVQNTYKPYMDNSLIEAIPEYSKKYSEILYLWDNISDQSLHDEVPIEWIEDEDFYNSLIPFTKNYAFLRNFMDKGIPDDEIISLGKFMKSHNVHDGRDIERKDGLTKKFEKQFKNAELINLSFDDYTFYLPDDLMEELTSRLKNGVVLIGGGVNECLKEVSLLLHILDIKHSIDYEYTY